MEGIELRTMIQENIALSKVSGLIPVPKIYVPAFLFELVADPFDHGLREDRFFLSVQIGFDLFGIEDRDSVFSRKPSKFWGKYRRTED